MGIGVRNQVKLLRKSGAAKHPFAVTPNTGMTKIAKRRHWPILDWSIDVPKR